MTTEQQTFETMNIEQFLNQLKLMNVTDKFRNTCKVLVNNYAHGKNVQHELTQALISIMIHEGHDMIRLTKKFLDSIDFANYELVFHPNKDDKGNVDGFTVEVEKVDHKGKDTSEH